MNPLKTILNFINSRTMLDFMEREDCLNNGNWNSYKIKEEIEKDKEVR